LDTRDPTNLGLVGPFVSPTGQDLQVTGSIPTSAGPQIVVPTGATGVVMNVTVVSPTGAGFLSIRPADAAGAPQTSSLNFAAGDIIPNSVTVKLPTAGADAGKIEITYDAFGIAGPRADVLIDVVGYTTSAGLADLTARLIAAEQRIAANRAVFFNAATGPDLTSATFTSIASMSLTNSVRCILLMNGTVDWDDNNTNAILFMMWNVDGTGVGGDFADQDDLAGGASNDSLSAVAGLVINPGTHAVQLQARAGGGTASLEDIGATAQCVPFDGNGNPASIGAAVAADVATADDPTDPTD
jgi:hypothetical protein